METPELGFDREFDEPPVFMARPIRIPDHMIRKGFWELFEYVPNDPLSTHVVRMVALHLEKLTDEDKINIIEVFNKRLDIKPNGT